MFADFSKLNGKFKVVGIAVSGGKDSMALLHYAYYSQKSLNLKPVCINVEHGIRGEQSKNDSLFVKNYCEKLGIPFYGYTVDCLSNSKKNKIPLEQAARELRYHCFDDAISTGKCDVIATAHHQRDNVESVLFNLFRGSGLTGLKGISDYENKVIRPFLSVSKTEIDEYVKEHNIDYVIDATNFDTDFTRNYIRLEVLPVIKKVFPKAETSISRLIQTVCEDDKYLNDLAEKALIINDGAVKIPLSTEKPIFCRAVIKALKLLGLNKDWEKVHAEDAYSLVNNVNGAQISLPKNITAIREYDGVVFFKSFTPENLEFRLLDGCYEINGENYTISTIDASGIDLKSGIYLDYDKVPADAVIRFKKDGDVFTKLGGGTKKLSDYFTDKKIPKRLRCRIPIIASKNSVLAILNLTVSEKVKADEKTKKLIKITKEKNK